MVVVGVLGAQVPGVGILQGLPLCAVVGKGHRRSFLHVTALQCRSLPYL